MNVYQKTSYYYNLFCDFNWDKIREHISQGDIHLFDICGAKHGYRLGEATYTWKMLYYKYMEGENVELDLLKYGVVIEYLLEDNQLDLVKLLLMKDIYE